MNKYQEAFWNLEHDFDNYCCTQGQLTYEDMCVFEELVDKETPMKPIVYNLNQFKCPKCKNQIKGQKMLYNMGTRRFDIKCVWECKKVYCPYCGQKLDWSDIDD